MQDKGQEENIDFETVDEHARRTTPSDASSFESLKRYFSSGFPAGTNQTDLYFARSALVWLCQNLATDFDTDVETDGPLFLIDEWRMHKRTIEEAYMLICQGLDVECKIITGCVRMVTGYEPGDCNPRELHTQWNVVRIGGDWKLVNVSFVGISIAGYSSGKWRKIEHGGERVDEYEEESSGMQVSGFNDYWFCTKPEEFIYKCYPDDPKWQLLPPSKQVKTAQEFYAMPCLYKTYFEYGLTIKSHPKCVLEAAKRPVNIAFTCRQKDVSKLDMTYSIYVQEAHGMSDSDTDVSRIVFNNRDIGAGTFEFEVRLPHAGVYKFETFVGQHGEGQKQLFYEAKIIGKEKTQNFRRLPIDPGPSGWGVLPKAEDFGLIQPTRTAPKIALKPSGPRNETGASSKSKDSVANVSFKVKEDALGKTQYKSTLHGCDLSSREQEELQNHVQTNVDEQTKQLDVKTSVPSAGEFALSIEAALIGEDFQPVCFYLITTLEKSAPSALEEFYRQIRETEESIKRLFSSDRPGNSNKKKSVLTLLKTGITYEKDRKKKMELQSLLDILELN